MAEPSSNSRRSETRGNPGLREATGEGKPRAHGSQKVTLLAGMWGAEIAQSRDLVATA